MIKHLKKQVVNMLRKKLESITLPIVSVYKSKYLRMQELLQKDNIGEHNYENYNLIGKKKMGDSIFIIKKIIE